MVDYTKRTGSTGTMMIRDTGTYVEYWIEAGPLTYNYQLPWAYVINGVASGWKYYRYEQGAGWERLGRAYVTYSQTVTFKLGDTGTAGFGGPTTFSVKINRAKAPNPPSAVSFSNLTPTSVHVTFTDGANNGDAIDARQIGYGTSPTRVQKYVSSDRSTTISGLAPGTTYYFWAQTHNSMGWSGWSDRRSITTPSAVYVKIGGVWKSAVPYVRVNGVWKVAQPWGRVSGVWKQIK